MKAIAIGQMLVVLLLVDAGNVRSDDFSKRRAGLDQLVAVGDWNRALATARRLREELPAEKRLTAWELPFGGEVVRAVLGDRHLYYQLSIPNSELEAPGRKLALPSGNANASHSDWRHVVVCVDLNNGKVLWSRAVEGLVNLSVAPKSDALYLWREKLLCLNAANGELKSTQTLPNRGQGIDGLKLGHTVAIPQTNGEIRTEWFRDTFSLFDPEHNATWDGDLSDFYLLAPNESRRLVPLGDGWRCIDPVSKRTLWESKNLNLDRPPLWLEKSIVVYSGNERTHGKVAAVSVETGQTLWSTQLGWGHSVGHHQLGGGGYPDDDWRPTSIVDKYIMALDGSGRITLLDPKDGSVCLSALLARNHLREPRLVGDTLVVCSFDWVRAFPLANLLNPAGCADATCRLCEARRLHALKRQKEAFATINSLLKRTPNYREAWSLRAEICRNLNLDDETSFSLCNALWLAGGNQDAALCDSWGLVRLFDLKGKPTWQVKQLNGKLYAGTQAGHLWSVSLDSLEPRLARQFDQEIESLQLSSELQATNGDSHKLVDVLKPDKPGPQAADGIPNEWWTVGGPQRIGSVVSYGGRQFRTILGGGVLILDGKQMSELPGKLKDVGVWEIHLSPYGPLGHGEGGIFQLDKDLRPQRVLYRPMVGGAKPKSVSIGQLRRNATTIGFVVFSDKGAALQIVSLDGKLLSEAPLGSYVAAAGEEQLIEVAEGYMFSDRQLTWIGTTPNQTWRFGPSLDYTSGPRWGDRWRYFGNPTLVEGHVYVTSLDGRLLVFNAAGIPGKVRKISMAL